MQTDPEALSDPAPLRSDALVIGSGPAGLMAAEVLSAAGHRVVIADQKPSFGRKFLMAGKSGLNLTKAEEMDAFVNRYDTGWLAPMVQAFGPDQVQAWARDLGQPLFTGSTGRVFPEVMKASPLLRAWLARLEAQGVQMQPRWRFLGWDGSDLGAACLFETPQGVTRVEARVVILALGGGSWARLGSDGIWADLPGLSGLTVPFKASNTGLAVQWSAHMAPHFGKPIKAVRWRAVPNDADGGCDVAQSRGEAILSERGLEGGGVYPLIPAFRDAGTRLFVDLAPDLTEDRLAARMPEPLKGLTRVLRNTMRWPPEKIALFHEWAPKGGAPLTGSDLAQRIKALEVRHDGLRPLDEAISTAGGLRRDALTQDLALRDRPDVFACGEMLDWDAPTGGYLITACLATGRWAGQAACARLARIDGAGD